MSLNIVADYTVKLCVVTDSLCHWKPTQCHLRMALAVSMDHIVCVTGHLRRLLIKCLRHLGLLAALGVAWGY